MSPENKKRGRPFSTTPNKTEQLNLRMTEAEKEEIQEVADMLKTTRVDAILQGIRLLKKKASK